MKLCRMYVCGTGLAESCVQTNGILIGMHFVNCGQLLSNLYSFKFWNLRSLNNSLPSAIFQPIPQDLDELF